MLWCHVKKLGGKKFSAKIGWIYWTKCDWEIKITKTYNSQPLCATDMYEMKFCARKFNNDFIQDFFKYLLKHGSWRKLCFSYILIRVHSCTEINDYYFYDSTQVSMLVSFPFTHEFSLCILEKCQLMYFIHLIHCQIYTLVFVHLESRACFELTEDKYLMLYFKFKQTKRVAWDASIIQHSTVGKIH